MDERERHAIEGLFQRLAEVERRAPPRDAEAEAFIRRAILAQPGAPYHMAQTIIAQEAALASAQARIDALEGPEARGGGLFGGLFGEEAEAPRRPVAPAPAQGGAGGFLGGAAQTALGVAGGILAAQALAGAFGAAGAAGPGELDSAEDDADLDGLGDFDLDI